MKQGQGQLARNKKAPRRRFPFLGRCIFGRCTRPYGAHHHGAHHHGARRPGVAAHAGLAMLATVLFVLPCAAGAAAGRNQQRVAPGASRQSIERAIEKARGQLLPRLQSLHETPRKDYPMGRLALVATALIEAGSTPEAPPLATALEVLRGMPLRKTYSVACYLFALDSVRRHGQCARDRPSAGGAAPRGIPSWVDHHTHRAVEWLLDARVPGGGWGYTVPRPRNTAFDVSNTQFAVLGLYTGARAGVPIPATVFQEIGETFKNALALEPPHQTFQLRPSATFESILGLTPPPSGRNFQARPGGWGYRTRRRRSRTAHVGPGAGRPGGNAPYPAMTAAGASSLVVVLRVLGSKSPVFERPPTQAAREWQDAVLAACAWITRYFDHFLVDDRGLCYRLYSLEKLGDLAGIDTFGQHDWYRRGAASLLERQHSDGSFGSYVDTALALLFLTRSTRALRPTAAPTLYTAQSRRDLDADSTPGAAPKQEAGVDEALGSRALVYIHRAGGFLPARRVFDYVASVRHRRLLPVAREVVANFPPNRQTELVPLLTALWGPRDAVTRFARTTLRRLTGLDADRPSDFLSWYETSRAIERLGKSEELTAARVRQEIGPLKNIPLRCEWVRIAGRRGLRSLWPLLIRELTVESVPYRQTIHGTLKLWYDAPIPTPKNDTAPAWRATAAAWQKWAKRRETSTKLRR